MCLFSEQMKPVSSTWADLSHRAYTGYANKHSLATDKNAGIYTWATCASSIAPTSTSLWDAPKLCCLSKHALELYLEQSLLPRQNMKIYLMRRMEYKKIHIFTHFSVSCQDDGHFNTRRRFLTIPVSADLVFTPVGNLVLLNWLICECLKPCQMFALCN